ncbi:hypothetical protein OROMI_024741 [Orobanche minor]
MEELRLVSKSLVEAPPTQEPINNKIHLSPSDLKLLFVGSIQKGSSLLETKLINSDFSRLSSTQHEDNTVSFFIHCNNAGAQFVHSVAQNVTVCYILEPIFIPPIVHSFFPLNEVYNYEGVSNPLLGVQITELSDGIFIGCTMNHVAGDGTTFWNFMNSWSEISRGNGLNQISNPPVFENWLRNFDIRLPLSLIKSKATSAKFIPPPLEERVFHFSKENIAGLKAKANLEVGNDIVISSLQSVLAHIWRGVIRNRRSDPDQETKLMLQIGFRRRLKPEIPDMYFGNAVQSELVELRVKQVVEDGLGFVALQMNKLVTGYNGEVAKKGIELWIKDPKLVTMNDAVRDAFATSSSPRFNVYGNDFGWGKPKAVRSGPGNKFDGKVTVFPGLEEGSMDIELCVSPEVLEAVGNDAEFMYACC